MVQHTKPARFWPLPNATFAARWPRGYIATTMRFEKIWIEQCRATRAIKRRFGVKDALDYLVGEKLQVFAGAARQDAAFARELPRFLAAVWRVFNEYEIAGYVAMQKPTHGPLSYVRSCQILTISAIASSLGTGVRSR